MTLQQQQRQHPQDIPNSIQGLFDCNSPYKKCDRSVCFLCVYIFRISSIGYSHNCISLVKNALRYVTLSSENNDKFVVNSSIDSEVIENQNVGRFVHASFCVSYFFLVFWF